jgi:hypothetical protein
MNDDMVKLLTQLQSYNVKQIEFVAGMVKNREWAGIARFLGGSFAMLHSIGTLLGMKPQDLIPTVRLGGAPFPSATGGLVSYATARTERDQEAAKKKLKSAFVSTIPAGAQIRKSAQGIEGVSQGYTTTPAGNKRFDIPDTFGAKLRAILFGPNTLPEAQAYFAKFDNKGSAKASGNLFDQ